MPNFFEVPAGLGLFVVALVYTVFRVRKVTRALDEYDEAEELLFDWLDVRPHLYIGQCQYAKSLVSRMINATIIVRHFIPSKENSQQLELLYAMLNELPPEYPPGFEHPGGLFYIKQKPNSDTTAS